MKETLKVINESVFSKLDKVERLTKLNNLRKTLFSEFRMHSNVSRMFDLIDDISLMLIGKKNCDKNESISESGKTKIKTLR